MPYKDPVISKIKARERNIRWFLLNPERTKERYRRYRIKNRDKINERQRIRYALHSEEAREYGRIWKKNNLERLRPGRRRWKNIKYNSDIQYKLTEVLRSRIRLALKNNQKIGSAIRDLGCTIEELKIYLEKQFKLGMNWNNWAINGWHIDHKIPLSSFDLTNKEQFLKACHYTNLQPMWWKENLKKNKFIIL